MADHQLRLRACQHVSERTPVGRLQFVDRRIEIGGDDAGVAPHAPEPRKMLHCRADARGFEPAYIGERDIGHYGRVWGQAVPCGTI